MARYEVDAASDRVMLVSLEQRLLRFLSREENDEERSFRDLRAMTIAQRVLDGECVDDAVLQQHIGDKFVFATRENISKFRQGDAVAVGDGIDFDASVPLVYSDFDAELGVLTLDRDRFSKFSRTLDVGATYCIDRRPLGLRGRLRDAVRAGFQDAWIAGLLRGDHPPTSDPQRAERAAAALAATSLNATQRAAGTAAIATESLALVQGPPGTGKTRLLAELVVLLARAGCRIALTSYTHRGVDNALAAIGAVDRSIPRIKIGNPGNNAKDLMRKGVRLNARAQGLPKTGAVIAGTCFAIAKLSSDERFHLTVFDEAGQMPIPHAIAGLLLARRWLMFGDHRQLAPVITASHADREVTESIFARLHRLYGGHLLDTTYRMNDGVCDVVSRNFYGGALRSAPEVATRRMRFVRGGEHDAVLDPALPVVFARVPHEQPGQRSIEEAALVADLCAELIVRHGIAPADIGVIAPFRAQVRQIRSALQKRAGITDESLIVDTVERIQGQEREVILISLAVGDPDTLDARAAFFFSTNRLNVALSRARTKAILIASPGAFLALPSDAESLRAAAVFKRLAQSLPTFDCEPKI